MYARQKFPYILATVLAAAVFGFAVLPAEATPGDPIAGIQVTVTASSGAPVAVATNEFGLAQFADLKEGKYRVRVAAERIRVTRTAAAVSVTPASAATPKSKAATVQIFVATSRLKTEEIKLPAGPYATSIEFAAKYPQTVRVLLSYPANN